MMDFYDFYMNGLPHGYDPMKELNDEERVELTLIVLAVYTVGLVVSVILCALIF